MKDAIVVRGARQHNLKGFDLRIPRRTFTVITGPSGSGKSSLAFDTIYAEGQRRYVESLSAYARQFLERMEKPDVDSVDGLSPAVAIEQKNRYTRPYCQFCARWRNMIKGVSRARGDVMARRPQATADIAAKIQIAAIQ